MTSQERQAISALSLIMALRMLGLFMVLPLFALYATHLSGATPTLIGLAMGIYGLTQALFQIPFGMFSDHVGRKPIITLGLIIFALGSAVSAMAHSIEWMIAGRALQGAGAIGSTIIALMADLTSEQHRTKAMAINGMTIGASFAFAMVLGPICAKWIHVNGIFWLATLFSLFALVILYSIVPTPVKTTWHREAEVEPHRLFTLLKQGQLARLNMGIFFLHIIFTASFVIIPIALAHQAGIESTQQWKLYLPTLVTAFVLTIPCIVIAEKKQMVKPFFIGCITLLGTAEILFWHYPTSLLHLAASLFIFFFAFSLLEAFLPSLVSRAAPASRKGTALGIYSCSQFLGIFVGGSFGGILYGQLGSAGVYAFCTLLTVVWIVIAFGMKKQQHHG